MTVDKEKLQSLGFPRKVGQTERKVVTNEDDGSEAGYHDVHWDGSQDAHVNLQPVAVEAKVVKPQQ